MGDNRIAMYIRLSNADEDTGKGKEESDSIVNQRGLINSFLDSSEELRDIPRVEFVDDGFTGKNTDRPKFQEMIKQIKEGHFSICITKDFSRFSRDYIEMGDYLECLFPFLHVRYISINDNYDSDDYKGTTGGLDVVMRTFIYDTYSRDLSEKVKTAQKQSAKKGRRVHGYPGYGYQMDTDNKAMDILDPVSSKVVRRIFESAINGMKPPEIARELTKDGILTPVDYFRQNHPEKKKYRNLEDRHRWNAQSVSVILKRYTYTGASVEMKRETVGPCMKKHIRKPKDEWIVVPGMHEAIVTEKEYEEAQKVFEKSSPLPKKWERKDYPLRSMMVCGLCGRHLQRYTSPRTKKGPYFYCKYGNEFGNENCKSVFTTKEDKLNEIVYDAIMKMISLAGVRQKRTAKIRKMMDKEKEVVEKCQKTIGVLKRDILRSYEDYALDRISKEEFQQIKERIEENIKKTESEMTDHELKIDREGEERESEIKDKCNLYSKVKNLTNEMVRAFIEKIVVYPGNEIEIKWKFKDPFVQDV